MYAASKCNFDGTPQSYTPVLDSAHNIRVSTFLNWCACAKIKSRENAARKPNMLSVQPS